jgi:predicted  nucleic acid-binding Zn-ribbon protein
MNSDLQHLIELQQLDLAAERARRRIEDIPVDQAALEARIAERTAALDAVKERISASQAARREIEKELAAVQTRLSKFKNQLMEVKTNKEYQAMQKEMSVAEEEISTQETRLLERMEEADVLAAELKAAERELKAEQAEVAGQRKTLDAERDAAEHELAQTNKERTAIAAQISAGALGLFEHVARHRRGQALSEARDGTCTQCHVRMRPQVFNEVRRNDSLIQCESCSRILYYVPGPASTVAAPSPSPEL